MLQDSISAPFRNTSVSRYIDWIYSLWFYLVNDLVYFVPWKKYSISLDKMCWCSCLGTNNKKSFTLEITLKHSSKSMNWWSVIFMASFFKLFYLFIYFTSCIIIECHGTNSQPHHKFSLRLQWFKGHWVFMAIFITWTTPFIV